MNVLKVERWRFRLLKNFIATTLLFVYTLFSVVFAYLAFLFLSCLFMLVYLEKSDVFVSDITLLNNDAEKVKPYFYGVGFQQAVAD